ncbi:hypothetical protein [Brevibacillus marinus]|uniref:hypothetical protein n=1 Tax=Brevibacillus marinus TaxID=2496837 RepID=UPI000F82B876|nr:hypothetical protein [Brevibacillus marinus]
MERYTRYTPLQEINLAAKLADLRAADYHNALFLSAIIELLIEKKLLTREELQAKAQQLDEQPFAGGWTLADGCSPWDAR